MSDSDQSVLAKKCKTEREDIPENVIVRAIRKGRLEAIRYLLENGLAPNRTIIANVWTLTEFACNNGRDSIVRLLIEKGADVDAQDKGGWTPLYWTCRYGHDSTARFLIEKGATINVQDKEGRTPLHLACNYGHESIARLLIEKGANIDAQDKDGWTPLHLACGHGHESIARLLIEKRANVDAQDKDGWTPLYWACVNGYESIARLLVEKGAYISTELLKEHPDLKVDRQIQFNRMFLYWIRTRFPDSFLGKDYLPRDMYRLIVRFYIRSEEVAEVFSGEPMK